MYFPYLFGKRSELLALRAAADVMAEDQRVFPIVEPVISNPDDLLRFMQAMQKAEMPAIVVTNPIHGDFKHGVPSDWINAVLPAFQRYPVVRPGYCCRPSSSAAQIATFLKTHYGHAVTLLYQSPHLSDSEFKNLAASQQVEFHICLLGKLPSSKRDLLPKLKLVDVFDNFNKLARNGDYEDENAEFFSDRHLSYVKDSAGFGDYTVIGSQFQAGGGQPAAVVIHVTFKDRQTGAVWVEHFLSDDTTYGVGRVERKYLQAVAKLCGAVKTRRTEFGIDAALAAYQTDDFDQHFPGLGKNKERQIYHHIALMNAILGGKL